MVDFYVYDEKEPENKLYLSVDEKTLEMFPDFQERAQREFQIKFDEFRESKKENE